MVAKKQVPVPIALPNYPKKQTRIFYAIDYFKPGVRSTLIQGWAFVPNVVSQIYIQADGKLYKPPMYSRADVKEAYAFSSKNEGFLIKVRGKIESFEMFLVDEKNKLIYSILMDNLLTQYELSEEIPSLDAGDVIERDFLYTVDECYCKRGKTYIRGWAHDGNDDCQVFIGVGEKIYVTRPVRRSDVMRAFSLEDDKHGFTALLPVKTSSFCLYLVNHSKHEIYKKNIDEQEQKE